MRTTRARTNQTGGLRLREILCLAAVIALLAVLLPSRRVVRGVGSRKRATRALLNQIAEGQEFYRADAGSYPPDFIPAGVGLIPPEPREPPAWTPTPALPPEALCYYLANERISAKHPYVELDPDVYHSDHNANGLAEIMDTWGRPVLYNRPRFRRGRFDNGSDPFHNTQQFDLYSVGRDGRTGSTMLPDPREDLPGFCQQAMDEAADGSGKDDMNNW